MDSNLEEAGNNRFNTVVDFFDGGIIRSAVDLGNFYLFGLSERSKDIFSLGKDFFCLF